MLYDKAMGTFTIVSLVVMTIFIAYASIAGYNNWLVGMQYEREVGTFFTYADRASDAKTKADYFNQYVDALEKNNLIKGCGVMYFCNQPNAQLAENFKVAKSLQVRLNELKLLDEKETAYQLGMTQMTENEFCWFPTGIFEQAYALNHGAWGLALTPIGTHNMCED